MPPGPVAVPLSDNVTLPGAIASNCSAASNPVPDAPVASLARTSVMSIRLLFTCWENVTFAPPTRMKLPSWTERTRSFVGSKINVNVTVESREASVTASGIVYGPPPTRMGVFGTEITTCADPTPADVVGTAASAGVAAAGV